MERIFKLSIALSSLLIAVSISYYYLYFLPHQSRVKLDLQTAEEEHKTSLYKQCILWTRDRLKDKEEAPTSMYTWFIEYCVKTDGEYPN